MNSSNKMPVFFSRGWPWIVLAAGLVSAAFLLTSAGTGGIGFPLDDAWIHQTYARNLAQHGEWAFIPGQPSAGSTAPAWSVLLAVGQLVPQLEPYAWTFLLGIACLAAIGLAAQAIYNHAQVMANPWPLAGILLVGEWHLVWGALSGMETALMGVLILLSLLWLVKGSRRWELLGLIIGGSIWVRPDGLTLLGPAVFVLALSERGWRKAIPAFLRLAGGFLVMALPYLLFNRLANGSFWPNTFYAKQAEYAQLQSQPFWRRYIQQLALPLTGMGVFLLPGFIFILIDTLRARHWRLLSAGIWFLGYAATYALRLPVTYQHGRYLMPAMPVFFVLGFIGTARLWVKIPRTRVGFVLSRALQLSYGLVWLAFMGIGARAFATDVAIIQTEMVATAHWVADNTPPDAFIAAHDIGALGYFGGRDLLDLAGLISPEVIPFIRDEARIAVFLREKHVDYLVTFPDWYPQLTADLKPVYQSGGAHAPAAGGQNMAVYPWPK